MNDQDLSAKIDSAGETLARIAAHLQTVDAHDSQTMLGRMRDGYQGHPRAAAYDGETRDAPKAEAFMVSTDDEGWRPLNSDPTGEAACRPDKAAHHRRELEKMASRIEAFTRTEYDKFLAIAYHYEPPRKADANDIAQVAKTNTKPEPNCDSCGRIPYRFHAPKYTGKVGKRTIRMCDTCAAWVLDFGTLPPIEYLEALEANPRGVEARKIRTRADQAKAKHPQRKDVVLTVIDRRDRRTKRLSGNAA